MEPDRTPDLRLRANYEWGFYPLDGFLSQKDYEEVVENMRLATEKFGQYPLL